MTGASCRVLVLAGVGAALIALAAPAVGSARGVPASATLRAQQVPGSAAVKPVGPPRIIPLRVRDPAQYARQKAAADAAYARSAASHRSVFGPTVGFATIPALSNPGLGAGTASTSATPPDTTGAIGPTAYMELVNSQIAAFNRNTLASQPIASATEDAFAGSMGTCDGQIKWDQAAGRWLYYSLDCRAAKGSEGFSFAFSKTSSPTPLTGSAANWCRYHVGTANTLEDYGKLGESNSQLIIGTNEFNDLSGSRIDSAIITFPKPANGSKVTTCPSESGKSFSISDFTPEPANIFGSSPNGFVVGSHDFSHLEMYTVAGTTPTVTNDGAVPVSTFAVPPNVPQPGTTDKLDSSDTRLTQANAAVDPALKAMAVWTQHTVMGPNGTSVVRWYELKAGVAAAPVQTGTVAVSGAFAFNGAIAPTAQGNAAAIDYDVGNATSNVTVRAQEHLPGDIAGSMANETTLATSTGVNRDFSCPSQGSGSASCRWGDYAGASPDPTCRGQVYGANGLNGATNVGHASWATQNFQLKVRTCPTASFTVTPTSPVHGSPATTNGSASNSPNGSIVKWAWKFGDGTTATTTTPTVNHTYTTAGTKKVALTVTDSVGLTGTTSKTITVS